MDSWNNFKTYNGNYVNSDEEYLRDANRPRDQYGFKLNNKGGDGNSGIGGAEDKEKIKSNYFKAQRYINISGGNTSYQDIPFTKTDTTIGLEFSQYGNIAEINDDGFILVKHSGLYLISVAAQYLKDGEWTSASLYTGPCGWYVRKEMEKNNWSNKPHMMVSSSNISFIVDLQSNDVLVPEAGGTVNGTIWFSIVKLG